jgi:hypothetical protein
MANAIYPLMAIAGFGSSFIKKSKDDDVPFWDTRDYYLFPADYTYLIDEILASPYGLMTQQIIMSDTRRLPGEGYHYYYNKKTGERSFIDRNFRYITFQKKKKNVNNEEVTYYRCYVGGLLMSQQDILLSSIVTKIFRTNELTIRIISIDTSGQFAKPIYMTEKYHEPQPFQEKAVCDILDLYETNKHHNIKVIMSAKRGTGKTFGTRITKKKYEKRHPSHIVKLYSDFDPTVVGVNVNNLILKEASDISPIIIVIDEIDEVFKDVYREKQNFDPRTLHTKNKMLS